MEDLESRNLSYVVIWRFQIDLKEEFSGRYDETIKIAELKKVG